MYLLSLVYMLSLVSFCYPALESLMTSVSDDSSVSIIPSDYVIFSVSIIPSVSVVPSVSDDSIIQPSVSVISCVSSVSVVSWYYSIKLIVLNILKISISNKAILNYFHNNNFRIYI